MSIPPFTSTIHVRAEDSHGEIGVVEVAAGPDFAGPPLHHHAFDETFFVLEGELTFRLGDALRTAGAGDVVFAPRGAHHTLANLSGVPARYLLVCNPGGFERRFDPSPEDVPEVHVVGPRIGDEPAGPRS
jgi:mannose-6-phosphate isomerase-like protein (cupin superfamily)